MYIKLEDAWELGFSKGLLKLFISLYVDDAVLLTWKHEDLPCWLNVLFEFFNVGNWNWIFEKLKVLYLELVEN